MKLKGSLDPRPAATAAATRRPRLPAPPAGTKPCPAPPCHFQVPRRAPCCHRTPSRPTFHSISLSPSPPRAPTQPTTAADPLLSASIANRCRDDLSFPPLNTQPTRAANLSRQQQRTARNNSASLRRLRVLKTLIALPSPLQTINIAKDLFSIQRKNQVNTFVFAIITQPTDLTT